MGFTFDAFLVSITSNLILNIISTIILYVIIFLTGVYGRIIIFKVKSALYFISNKPVDLDYFIMSMVFRSQDNSLLDKIVYELNNKYNGRLIEDKKESANTKVVDLESNRYIFEAKVSFNPNVVPELEETTNDYSVTIKLRTKKLHYRDITSTIKDTFLQYNGIIRGMLGNDLGSTYQVSIPMNRKRNELSGSIKDIEIMIDSNSLTMSGGITPLFEVLKMAMISRNLTIYKMVNGKMP